MATMKIEAQQEVCCVCGSGGELMTPEEHDAASVSMQTPLRSVLLQLNNNKVVPDGRLCSDCIRRALEAYEFSSALSSRTVPPLSEKIRALRRRLHELTQKIDVFIVVGGPGVTNGGAYSEDDIIMVDRAALEAATAADDAQLERAKNARGDNVYQCTICPQSFQKVSEYREHSATHPADALHSCWTCGAQFSRRDALNEHSTIHDDDCANVCYICHGTFMRASDMRAHEASCPARCPAAECGVTASSRADLAQHAAAAHAAPPATLLCPACFKELDTPAELSAHQMKHRQAKQFVCGYDACILRFASRRQLLAHIKSCHGGVAEDETPPAPPSTTCSHCSRTFGSVAAMKRHMKVHRDEIKNEEAMEQEMETETIEYLEIDSLDDGLLEDTKPEILYL